MRKACCPPGLETFWQVRLLVRGSASRIQRALNGWRRYADDGLITNAHQTPITGVPCRTISDPQSRKECIQVQVDVPVVDPGKPPPKGRLEDVGRRFRGGEASLA